MEKGMSKITQKFISTLVLIVMMLSMVMPLTANAAQGDYTIKDMRLNTVIFFEGDTYSSIDYSCKRGVKGTYSEETAGIVWKINRLKKSIVIQLSDLKFRTIPVEQVTRIRPGKVLDIDTSTMEQLQNGELNLDIDFKGIKTEVLIENHSLVKFEKTDTGVKLSVSGKGDELAFSKVTIIKEGEEPVPFYIIKDASGNISLDIESKCLTAGAEAEIFEKITVGDTASLAIEDNKIVASNSLQISNADKSQEYVQLDTEAKVGLSEDKTHLEAEGSARLEVKNEEMVQLDGKTTIGKGEDDGRTSLELTGTAKVEYKNEEVFQVDTEVDISKDENKFYVGADGTVEIKNEEVLNVETQLDAGKDGEKFVVGAEGKVDVKKEEVLEGRGELSYDSSQGENADIMAGGRLEVKGEEKFNNLENPADTKVIKTVKSLVERIRLLF